jgi:hypothetical protein
MNGDGRDDLLGAWTGQGVYYLNSMTGQWVQMASPATMITAGDLDGDGIADLIGIWPAQNGIWVKYSNSGTWANLTWTADWIATGKMRANGQALGTGEELRLQISGLTDSPSRIVEFVDLSANSPGRDGFTPIIEKNLRPSERKSPNSVVSRTPGPGELRFKFIQQKNIFPLKDGNEEKKERVRK